MWGVQANFINKINENIEFELININKVKQNCEFQKLEDTLF